MCSSTLTGVELVTVDKALEIRCSGDPMQAKTPH